MSFSQQQKLMQGPLKSDLGAHMELSDGKRTFMQVFWLVIFAMIVSLVCFMGNDCKNVQFIPGNLSKAKLVA